MRGKGSLDVHIEQGMCACDWRKEVEALLQEVRRLRDERKRLLEIIEREAVPS